MPEADCPNGSEIIAYATSRGVINALLVYEVCFGWSLQGEGRDENGLPLFWVVAEECGISYGGGSTDTQQICPERFKYPL